MCMGVGISRVGYRPFYSGGPARRLPRLVVRMRVSWRRLQLGLLLGLAGALALLALNDAYSREEEEPAASAAGQLRTGGVRVVR